MWSKSKRPVRPILEGSLDYSRVSFTRPHEICIHIGGKPWKLETCLVMIQNLFEDLIEGKVSVVGLKSILTPIIERDVMNDREQVTVTTISFYAKVDEITIIENDFGISSR